MADLNSTQFDIFSSAEMMNFGDIHLKHDPESGLNAIIAIHNTNLGPALGGCRFVPYTSSSEAIYDAMQLAQGMSYKAAIAGLALGGGKSVIIQPKAIIDRKKLFSAFGRFVEDMNGRYITAVDSGTSVEDMDVIATQTKYVESTSEKGLATGDPSPYTALGVRRGIEAAVKTQFAKDSLDGIHIAIQGMGHVGYYLAKELHQRGALLTYCDINRKNVERAQKEFGGTACSPEEIYDVSCDVFSPCALGGAINHNTIKRLQTSVIVGAANNQLTSPEIGEELHKLKILYAPDYVVNAGGLIQIAMANEEKIVKKINGIYDTVLNIFHLANQQKQTTAEAANQIAKQIIVKAGTKNAA